MSRFILNHRFLAVLFVGFLARFAAGAPPPPATPDEADDLAAFAQLDGNEDGRLSGKEAVSVMAYDTDGDQRITKAEFLAAPRRGQRGRFRRGRWAAVLTSRRE